MRGWATLTTTLLVLAAAGWANAEDLLWDNYPNGIDALPQNGLINMSSERNTQIVESTWVVDDVVAGVQPGYLTRMSWIGAREASASYSKADVLFLNSSFNTLLELTDVDYTVTQERNFLDPFSRIYEAELAFDPQSISLSSLGSHFYVGVRLVGDGSFDGRNQLVASSTDSTVYGQTEGYIKAAVFGAADWTPTTDIWYGAPSPGINFEFAFKLYSDVPEPASLGLMLVGGLLFARRR